MGGDVCGVHFVFYGAHPAVAYYLDADGEPTDFPISLLMPSQSSTPIVCQPPATPGGPCEAYVAFEATNVEAIIVVFGLGGGDWPYPVRADGDLGCAFVQSIKDIKTKQLAAGSGGNASVVGTCALMLDTDYRTQHNLTPEGVQTITVYWRGDLETSGGPQCPTNDHDVSYLHFFNVVDFPSPQSYAYPGYNKGDVTYYTCGTPGPDFKGYKPYPPDDPKADMQG